jgi:hypothetical protein
MTVGKRFTAAFRGVVVLFSDNLREVFFYFLWFGLPVAQTRFIFLTLWLSAL